MMIMTMMLMAVWCAVAAVWCDDGKDNGDVMVSGLMCNGSWIYGDKICILAFGTNNYHVSGFCLS